MSIMQQLKFYIVYQTSKQTEFIVIFIKNIFEPFYFLLIHVIVIWPKLKSVQPARAKFEPSYR
jgi:hypothetical protein